MKFTDGAVVPENFDDCVALLIRDDTYLPLKAAYQQALDSGARSWTYVGREDLKALLIGFAIREGRTYLSRDADQ